MSDEKFAEWYRSKTYYTAETFEEFDRLIGEQEKGMVKNLLGPVTLVELARYRIVKEAWSACKEAYKIDNPAEKKEERQ